MSRRISSIGQPRSRAVHEHEILRISGTLPTTDAASHARHEVLKWAQKRCGGQLPPGAWDHSSFEYLAGGRNSIAVRLDSGGADLWAIRAEDPDKTVPGRVWTTEVVVGSCAGQLPQLSTRQMVSSPEECLDIEPHTPGFMQQVIDVAGLHKGRYALSVEPQRIEGEDAEDFVDMLVDQERVLPILALTTDASGDPAIDPAELAKATLGTAHTCVLSSEAASLLTDRVGRIRSVFGGAIRAYLPGFRTEASPYSHRLIIRRNLDTAEKRSAAQQWFRSLAARESVLRSRVGKEVLPFSAVRSASLQLLQKRLKDGAASDAEQLSAARRQIEALELQIDDLNGQLAYFDAEHQEAEARAEVAESQAAAATAKIDYLLRRLKEQGVDPDTQIGLPSTWGEFGDWCDDHFAGRLILSPKARRQVGRPDFEDVQLAARCIRWLVEVCRPRRIEGGGGSLRDEAVEDGIRNSHCGGDTYKTMWEGQRYDVDWHIKNGGNVRDPRRCLRIYYFWDSATQRIVVDEMPAHRRTDAT